MTNQMADHRPQPAAGAEIGSLIGGAFGLVFLIVNSSQFSTVGRIGVLVVGIAVFAVIVFIAMRSLRRMGRMGRGRALAADAQTPTADTRAPAADGSVSETATDSAVRGAHPFGRSYWVIVAIEALALFAGTRLLSGIGHPELGVAWVAFVVGTHFYALGSVFKLGRFHVLATVVTACGIVGFIVFFAGALDFIPVLSGIIPGFVLLAFGIWALVPVDD